MDSRFAEHRFWPPICDFRRIYYKIRELIFYDERIRPVRSAALQLRVRT